MKKTLLFLSFLLIINALSFAQTHIPDKNFAKAIRENCSSCINANDNLTAAAADLTILHVYDFNILSLAGVEGFTKLKTLDCGVNQLISLPKLPQSLIQLYCFNNKLTALPQLPQNLTRLFCENNQLTTLPQLPQSLIELNCANNQLSTLPQLPQNLKELSCENNQLTTLSQLPQSLIELNCANNQLSTLPQLPQNLKELSCENNKNISCINGLLALSLKELNVSNTKIKCLPNKPIGISNNPLPICNATNSGNCFIFPITKGNVYYDFDDDGIKNNSDVSLSSQLLEVKPYGYTITNKDGNYSIATDTSKSLTITLKNISPKFDIKPNSRTVNISASFAQSYDNQDFRLVPKQVYGDLEISIVSSVQRPGFEGTLTLTYRNIGTIALNGQIKLEKDPILLFLKAIPSQSSINGNTITWDYDKLLPFETRVITVNVKVPATTPIATKLNNKMFATFRYLSDYYETEKVAEITTVVGSYDPNDKTADVKNIDPKDITARKPITYTIRFQNTGTYYAERVEVQDTISPLFDLSTLKTIAVSHPNYQVSIEIDRFKAGKPTVVKWTFDKIFLLDSTTNEAASHGFIRFSIQPKQGLPIGTSLENKAFIYFDYNQPIITNTSKVKVAIASKTAQVEVDIPLKIYPNPSADRIFVETSSDLKGELFLSNLLGQVIDYQLFNQNELPVFDLRALPQGVYVVTLKTAEGSVSERVVKK
jgi:uncharacterized repeat protein (TIGR01451 family)